MSDKITHREKKKSGEWAWEREPRPGEAHDTMLGTHVLITGGLERGCDLGLINEKQKPRRKFLLAALV